jgi:hypothetical protein
MSSKAVAVEFAPPIIPCRFTLRESSIRNIDSRIDKNRVDKNRGIRSTDLALGPRPGRRASDGPVVDKVDTHRDYRTNEVHHGALPPDSGSSAFFRRRVDDF